MPKGVYPRPAPGSLAKQDLRSVNLPTPLIAACKHFEREVGGRQKLIEALAVARLTENQEYLVGAIADPRNSKLSLARICAIYGLKFVDLIHLFRDAKVVKAQVVAIQKIADALPEVAGDLMARAVPHMIPCGRCGGTGKIRRPRLLKARKEPAEGSPKADKPCSVCGGEGQVVVQPTLETQKVALELGGLLKPGGGAQVQVNVQASGGGGISHSEFLRRADEKLYQAAGGASGTTSGTSGGAGTGRPEIVDVEAEPAEEPEESREEADAADQA